MIANLDSLRVKLSFRYPFCFSCLYFLSNDWYYITHIKMISEYKGSEISHSYRIFKYLNYNNLFYRPFVWKVYDHAMKRNWIPILFCILNHCSYSQEIMIHSNVYLYTVNNISQHHLWCADIPLRNRQICKMVITTIS